MKQDSVMVRKFQRIVDIRDLANQNGTVPYHVEVVDPTLTVTLAPQDITVTLLREVFSECSGLLFRK